MPPLPPPDAVPKPKKMPLWATYIPDRAPAFKPHTNSGQALNAAQYMAREVWVFRFVDGTWMPWFYWNGRSIPNWRPNVDDVPDWMTVKSTTEWVNMESMFQATIHELPV